MDSLTNGTPSLLRYDDHRRQLDLLCVIGEHSSIRYAGARPFRQRWTVTAVRNWIRSGMSNQCSSCLLMYVKPRTYFQELEITRAAHWELSEVCPSHTLRISYILLTLCCACSQCMFRLQQKPTVTLVLTWRHCAQRQHCSRFVRRWTWLTSRMNPLMPKCSVHLLSHRRISGFVHSFVILQ